MRERARCGACGSDDAEVLFPVEGAGEVFPLARCRSCSHFYLRERPPASEIHRYYPEDYPAHRRLEEGGRERRSHRHRRIRIRPGLRVLDVGCGSGYDLLPLKRRGCEVYGIEPDGAAAEEARRMGVIAVGRSLEDCGFPDRFFDVATMNHVLEHLHEPREALGHLRRLMRPEGRVHLLFPTAEGVCFRWFRGDWAGLGVPHHLQFFTHDSFVRMARQAGFRILLRACRTGPRYLRQSLANAARRSPWARVVLGLIRCPPGRQFVRMANRYVMNLMRWGDIAEYVITPA